jgi:ERCC4-type nuclease
MIWVDYREKDLIAHLDTALGDEKVFRVCNLPIGDVVIGRDSSNEVPTAEDIHCILERKTVSDMAASIRDGRYEEQSFRLNDSAVPNHNIVYVIEGDHCRELSLTNRYCKNKITPDVMYAAFTSVLFFKGFSLYNSRNTQDTTMFIVNSHRKLLKELYGPLTRGKPRRTLYYDPSEPMIAMDASGMSHRGGGALRKKSSYTTSGGIHMAMLCQVPGVSETIATALLTEYETVPRLVKTLTDDPCALDCFKSGTKRLSKSTVESLKAVLISP